MNKKQKKYNININYLLQKIRKEGTKNAVCKNSKDTKISRKRGFNICKTFFITHQYIYIYAAMSTEKCIQQNLKKLFLQETETINWQV